MPLFRAFFVGDELAQRKKLIRGYIEAQDPDEFVNTSPDELANWLVAEYSADVPRLNREGIHVAESGDAQVNVGWQPGRDFRDPTDTTTKGTYVVYAVPFEGDPHWFRVYPVRVDNPPHATIHEGELTIRVETEAHRKELLERGLENNLREIDFYLDRLRQAGDQFNAELKSEVPELINLRRKKILADRELVESLGYPIRKRSDAPETYKVPIKRKRPMIRRPKPGSAKFERPDPELEMEEYEHILSILRNMVVVMEKSPKAFTTMEEEHLRDQFLVQLNGQYEGRASGETFNAYGKTDIIIKEGDRNIFIAECKFWRGPTKLSSALDQLLRRYLTWRDTKVAVLIFNRNKDFTKVINSVRGTVRDHPLCIRVAEILDETSSRYVFHHPDDRERQIILTVLAFDVPR